jgi:hypothetical protein
VRAQTAPFHSTLELQPLRVKIIHNCPTPTAEDRFNIYTPEGDLSLKFETSHEKMNPFGVGEIEVK